MQRSVIELVLTLLGVIAFNLLFWQQTMGLNTLWFAGLMMAALFYLHPRGMRRRSTLLLAGGTLLTAVWVVVFHSALSKAVHLLSFCTTIGISQQRSLRFLWYGFLLGLWSVASTPRKLWRNIRQQLPQPDSKLRIGYYARLIVFPLLIVLAFYYLYRWANPHFSELTTIFWDTLLYQWTVDIYWPRVGFILLGLLLCGGILLPTPLDFFHRREATKSDGLHRLNPETRRRRLEQRRNWDIHKRFSPLSLRNEYRAGGLLLYALNVLLFLVNLTDLRHVWWGFGEGEIPLLKNYVHEGTYLLIAAILLAMVVLLYFFRSNLNFFPDGGALRRAAYLWIGQNAFLTLSVGLRNYHYIDYHGLAYLRIGVLLFLLLVLYGLWTLYLKIRDRRSAFFLLQRNAWAVYLILLLASSFNWDVWITRYNLDTPTQGPIDVGFLLRGASDKNLFLLEGRLDELAERESFPLLRDEDIRRYYHWKVRGFERRVAQQGWPSWNLPDHRNQRYLREKRKNQREERRE
ncbi:MAG: DUF4173 domain-containing protein [Bacteroidota bacterium]